MTSLSRRNGRLARSVMAVFLLGAATRIAASAPGASGYDKFRQRYEAAVDPLRQEDLTGWFSGVAYSEAAKNTADPSLLIGGMFAEAAGPKFKLLGIFRIGNPGFFDRLTPKEVSRIRRMAGVEAGRSSPAVLSATEAVSVVRYADGGEPLTMAISARRSGGDVLVRYTFNSARVTHTYARYRRNVTPGKKIPSRKNHRSGRRAS